MSDRRKPFPFHEFEPAWQQHWDTEKTFRTPNPGEEGFDASRPKTYILDMFPYPSGAGLHVGHPEGYTATDILARARRLQGHNVLHPMGWDAFGLPAEQYAIKTGQHPRVTTEANVENFRRQLKMLGFSYDWDREINTTDPGYVRWTQWIFLQLYHSYFDAEAQKARPVAELEAKGWTREQIDAVRLAYVAEVPVNWSPDLGTVLANEEVEEWREKGFTVERRPLRQWMLRITAYAERLANELDDLDWPEGIKLLQRNWIGRSEGAQVVFEVLDAAGGKPHRVEVFTTRPDTLFGATYMVLAPEHPLVDAVTADAQRKAVHAYRAACAAKSDLERTDLAKEKSGVFTGGEAVNPVNGERIPVWIADYVLMGYGTGAIMAVPGHDTRDFEFATQFGLPIVEVVRQEGQTGSAGVPPASGGVTPFLEPAEGISRHSRRLPHWEQDGKTYFITWRTADSLPAGKLEAWRQEREAWTRAHPKPWKPKDEAEYHRLFSEKIDAWLDAGHGACPMKNPEASAVVANALRHFDGQRYDLVAFAVMPNHVHVLVHLCEGEELEKVLHSWKSFTSKRLNQLLGTEGSLWQPEYWDRLIRDEEHFMRCCACIDQNPVRAGLREGEYLVCSAKDAGGTPALPEAFTGEGVSVNSGFLDGMATAQAKKEMIAWLEAKEKGRREINYKLRDWLFSRQRYWGEPFPIVWEAGAHRAVPEEDLPVLQPELDDFQPTGDPRGPLVKATDWICYSDQAERETNTMPQWAGSCWYYLRYCDPRNDQAFIAKEAESYWMGTNGRPGGVDLYVGGTEHAVLHLLYARFWHKVLHDLGHVSTPEPFQRLVNQGLILGEDGRKMSKSFGNVVNPDDVVRDYGADSLRLFEMFMGPLEDAKPWNMKGVEGVHRFLARVWRLAMQEQEDGSWMVRSDLDAAATTDKALRKVMHETIRKVSEDIDRLSFNTAISQMMVCTKALAEAGKVPVPELRTLLVLLNPFAPHLSEEVNARLMGAVDGYPSEPLSAAAWPSWDPEALVEDEVEIVVQVNGKLRDRVRVAADAAEDAVEQAALAAPKVQPFTEGKTVRKVIVVPGKLVNIVAN